MRSYGTARTIYSILGFIAWASVVTGFFIAWGGASTASSFSGRGAGLMGALPGIIIMIGGIFLVGHVQSGRANVDTAEYTQQMLKIARDQLEVSNEQLKVGMASQVSFKAESASESETKTTGYTSSGEPKKKSSPTGKQIVEAHINDPEVEKGAKDGLLEYSGKMIEVKNATYFLDGAIFTSLEKAQAKIKKKL